MNREQEARHLLLADHIIAEGQLRIKAQEALILRVRDQGQDTVPAEQFLDLLRHTLARWNNHRDMIVAAIAAGFSFPPFADVPELPRGVADNSVLVKPHPG